MMRKRKAAKSKARKVKPRKIVPTEPLDPYEEYGNSSPHNLTHDIWSEIDDGNRNLENLVNAIHTFDQYHLTNPRPDKKPLIELLKSRGTTAAENKLLADLIDRVVLKWPVGARRRPAYMITEAEHAYLNACADVEDSLRDAKLSGVRLSVRDAITNVAKKREIPYNKLLDFYQGRARSTRKKKE